MRTTTITAICCILSAVSAQHNRIHKKHNHGALYNRKRDIVWTTQVDIVTEYVDITTTIWVEPSTQPPAPVPTTSLNSLTYIVAPPSPTTLTPVYVAPTPSTTPVISTSTSSSSPIQTYAAPQSAPAPAYDAPAPSSSSTSTIVAQVVPTPVYVTPVVQTPVTPVYVVPIVQTPVAAAVVTPTPAIFVATSVSPAVIPAAAATTESSSSSYQGTCASGFPCSGDITYYDTGLGACGWTNDGLTENVVALPHGLMGTQSNGNPYCGMYITVSKNGKTVKAKVVDKCMGCLDSAIDLSRCAFDELADESVGRTTAEWWFN